MIDRRLLLWAETGYASQRPRKASRWPYLGSVYGDASAADRRAVRGKGRRPSTVFLAS